MHGHLLAAFTLTLTLQLIGGCAPLVVGAAAGGAAVAQDQRTADTLVDDHATQLQILNTMVADEELVRNAHVSVTCYNGVVLLTGETPNERLRARVERMAAKAQGVRAVKNELVIAQPSEHSQRRYDAMLTGRVKKALLSTKRLDGSRVKVITERGSVFLMGLVSREEGNQAAEIVRRIPGVRRVVKVFEYTS